MNRGDLSAWLRKQNKTSKQHDFPPTLGRRRAGSMGWGTTHSEHLLDTRSQFFKINETRRKSALIPYLETLPSFECFVGAKGSFSPMNSVLHF